jgi:hypothetical protein
MILKSTDNTCEMLTLLMSLMYYNLSDLPESRSLSLS